MKGIVFYLSNLIVLFTRTPVLLVVGLSSHLMRIQFAIKCGRLGREKISTRRELSAIEFSLRSFTDLLKSTHVKWFTDSQAAATIVEVGGMKFDLHMLAINIFTFCLNNQITLDIQWIPREQNTQADYISKLVDPHDWQITEALFDYLETLWGPHTVDCFANYYNHKLPRFFFQILEPKH